VTLLPPLLGAFSGAMAADSDSAFFLFRPDPPNMMVVLDASNKANEQEGSRRKKKWQGSCRRQKMRRQQH
jgi:hypothetical protein